MKKLFIVLCFNLLLFGAGLTFSKGASAEEILKAEDILKAEENASSRSFDPSSAFRFDPAQVRSEAFEGNFEGDLTKRVAPNSAANELRVPNPAAARSVEPKDSLEVLYSSNMDGAILSINDMKGLYRVEAGKMDEVSKIFNQYFEWEKTGAKNADADSEISRLSTVVVFVAKGEDETPALGEVELVYSLSSQNEGQPQLKIDIDNFKKIKTGLKASKYFKPDALYLDANEVARLQRVINPEFAAKATELAKKAKEQDNK